MKRILPLLLISCLLVFTPLPLNAVSPEAASAVNRVAAAGEAAVRFEAVPVFVDPHGSPLAAYQFELSATNAKLTIVGIENGQHPAYAEAPFYDPEVIAHGGDRIVLAAFSLLGPQDLPTQRTRVATVMVQVERLPDAAPAAAVDYQLNLIAAGNPAGQPIPATLDCGDTP